MGGGSSSRYRGTPSESTQSKVKRARQAEQRRLQAETNQYLGEELARFNDRDHDTVRERLSEIEESVADIEIDSLLLGGSVAKHTAVDGISDVDALVVLDTSAVGAGTGEEMLESLERQVRVNLDRGDVDTISRGKMAVTVTYRDGTEVQLLPALRHGDTVAVPDADSGGWRMSKPGLFRERLTAANKQTGSVLVPAVKVIKAINDGLPKQRQLSGYHIEALAVDSAATYEGDRSVRDVVLHVLKHSSERVLRPITDVTGQSAVVDADLMGPGSDARRRTAALLRSIHTQLSTAATVAQWRAKISLERS